MLFNEFKFLTSPTPTYMIYWVTQTCNFTCEHCFNYIENAKPNYDLTLDEIRRVSKGLNHLKYVTLSGGEPLIRKDLAEIASIFYKQNDLHVLNVVTNGWFVDRTVAFARQALEACPNLHISIAISVDGFRETHDSIRMKQGSFDRALNTVAALKELAGRAKRDRLTCCVNATYNARNSHEMTELVDFFSNHIRVPFYVGFVRGADIQDPACKNVDIDHFRSLQPYIENGLKRNLPTSYPFHRLRLAVDATVQDIIYNSAKHNKMTVPCKAGKKGFVLTANGEVLLCEILNIRLGNVRDYDYDALKILSLPESQKEMQKIVADKCHCTWECFQSLNVVHSPSLYPTVAKKLVKQLIPLNIAGTGKPPARPQTPMGPDVLAADASPAAPPRRLSLQLAPASCSAHTAGPA